MSAQQFRIRWVDSEREPKCEPNPNFPEGVDLPGVPGVPSCKVELSYPAKRCGFYIIDCLLCGARIGCTTAGRADDPRSAMVPCRPKPSIQQ